MTEPATFACTATPGFAELLAEVGCSIVLSTYQAGKLIVLSSNGGQVVQLPRTFDKPMGLAYDGHRLAVATREAVVVLGGSRALASEYPAAPGRYDELFVPTATYFTGELDIHDLAWGTTIEGGPGLWAVNTRFSCLGLIDDRHHFRPTWRPPWVSELTDDDRCHLNGLALRDGRPAYVTALGTTDTPRGWRERKLDGGVLYDVIRGEEVLAGLAMPHSPRLFDGVLYLLLSARGEVVRLDPEGDEIETVVRVPSYLRGMTLHGHVVFVGMSRLRKGSSLGGLPLARAPLRSGVLAFDLTTGRLLGELSYQSDVEEIYDVAVLPGLRRPGLLGLESPLRKAALSMPGTSYWASPQPVPGPAPVDAS